MAKKPEKIEVTDEDKKIAERVSWYTMPQKYIVLKKESRALRIIVIALLAVGIVGGGSIGLYFITQYMQAPKVVVNEEPTEPTEPTKEEPTEPTEPTNGEEPQPEFVKE